MAEVRTPPCGEAKRGDACSITDPLVVVTEITALNLDVVSGVSVVVSQVV